MPQNVIYLDNHATTPVDGRVLEAMLPFFTTDFGNPGSVVHAYGERARKAVEEARESIADNLGAEPREIVFTSGATESNNLAIRGVAERGRKQGNHLVSMMTEHKAVLEPLERLGRRGFGVTLLAVEPHGSPYAGRIDPPQVADALRDNTLLVSVMLANNEVGVLQPIREIAAICKERGVLLHCDATQGVGKLPVDVNELGVDLMSFSAHKIYGPKGVGGLYVRRRDPIVRLEPQITGGGQQEGRRAGTLNPPGIVGLATALRLCLEELPSETARLETLRRRLYEGLMQAAGEAIICGPALDARDANGRALRLPGNLNIALPGLDGEALMLNMPEVAVSSGAACTSANPEPSHVLRALGVPEDLIRGSLRFGLGRFNTKEAIDGAIQAVTSAVQKLRALA
jgi:cysteine desulfurase